jgi:hypothetical protein
MKAVYLIIGNCGVGKTWCMKELIAEFKPYESKQIGLYRWIEHPKVSFLGVWDGSMFEGSDRLSMAVMADNWLVKDKFSSEVVIADGDRFTNSKFIESFDPIIVRIKGDGVSGRAKRGSNQTSRHLQAIATRVRNITPHFEVEDSADAFNFLMERIRNGDHSRPNVTKQGNLNDFLNIEI